ncbi:hypothetical protein GF1_30140 [Desulfolithobacter dissulfuricans]|uniref:Orc1-like AAA ATPase domain-containing protein n=1 Tax=Desulfolithobacter dissulfuricans TaxID=2795293 RepID=A0A915U3I9_9BACT|nr:hypothetical protein [Desulfolithobacter dissulfuricans]BCO10638.1 hypothetical protein GF1_30140 [Desulfolithobacter dissulfuricans]
MPATLQNQRSETKYSSPVFRTEVHLDRPRLTKYLNEAFAGFSSVVIEAQAGQGKSILAAQYLKDIEQPFLWYNIDETDRDLITFLLSFITGLKSVGSTFSAPLVEKKIAGGEVFQETLPEVVNLIHRGVEAAFQDGLLIIFDDLHLLENTATLDCIRALVQWPGSSNRFLLLSRSSLRQAGFYGVTGSHRLTNSDLAFQPEEIAELYCSLLELALPVDQIAELHTLTDGWVMGLVMAQHVLRQRPQADFYFQGVNSQKN